MKNIAIYIILTVVALSCKDKQQPQTQAPKSWPVVANITPKTPAMDATKDAEYMMDTYANALYAIKAAEVVKQKSDKSEIKAVAQKIEKTNREVFKDLDLLATAKKISLPSKLSMAQLTELNKLEQDTANLEKTFLEQMENDHKRGVELLKKISKESEDNEISTVAISCLATVKSQYDEVVALKERLSL